MSGRSAEHASTLGIVVAIAAVIGWALMLRRTGEADVYAGLGPYSLAVLAASIGLVWRAGVRDPRRADPPSVGRDLIVGVVVGALMTAGTYVAYGAMEHVVPGFRVHVGSLYRAARTESLPLAVTWTVVVICAEEALFRVLLFGAVSMRTSARVAAAVSLVAYVAVQLGSGSWIVALAALVCGSFWTIERVLTRSWIAPLVSHAIWTLVVVHALPVNAA